MDASVAIKWHLHDEELIEEASALLAGFMAQRWRLVAPSLIRYEMANSLEQARRRQRLDADGAAEELRHFLAFGVHAEVDDDDLIAAAQRIAGESGLSLYDAVYVALAQAHGVGVVTNDERLLRLASGYPVTVHHLRDLGAPP